MREADLQRPADQSLVVPLNRPPAIFGGGRCGGSRRSVADDVAFSVQHHHIGDVEVRHRGRHQALDAADGGWVQGLPRPRQDRDRSLRRLDLVAEDGVLRQGQVDARLVHAVHRHDGPGQLPLQSPLVVDLLGELGQAHVGLVEQLEAHGALQGQGRAHQPESCLGHEVEGHKDGAAAVLELVGRLLLVELGDDRRGVGVAKAGEQHAIVRLEQIEIGRADDNGQDRANPCDQHDLPRKRVRPEPIHHRHIASPL